MIKTSTLFQLLAELCLPKRETSLIPGEINRDYSVLEHFTQYELLGEMWPNCKIERYFNNHSQQIIKVAFDVKRPNFSTSYRVEILYLSQSVHVVYIKNPKITPSLAIHMYSDRSLCLYYPSDISPYRHIWIAKDLLPLAIKWIGHYEEWLFNGNIWPGIEAPGHDFLMQQIQYKNLQALQHIDRETSIN